jgi:hypothetical protein
MLYAFFWAIHRHLKFICQRSKTAYKLQTRVNHPEESIQHSEHGESLKSREIKMHNSAHLQCNITHIIYSLHKPEQVCGAIKYFWY